MILFVLSITAFIFHKASAQSFSCDTDVSKPLCPGTVVTCTCLVTGTVSQTWWTFSALCNSPIAFRQVAPCSPASGTCGPFISSSANNCQTSKLFVTMATSVSGLLTECRDMSTGLPGILIGSASSFKIQDAPGLPVILNISIGSHQLTVTWTPPTTGGVPTSYNVTINDSSNTQASIPANGHLQHTFPNLTNGTLYTVSVVAINCAGQNKTLIVQKTDMEPITVNITPSSHMVPVLTGSQSSRDHVVIMTTSSQGTMCLYAAGSSPCSEEYKDADTEEKKMEELTNAVESMELDNNVAYGTVL